MVIESETASTPYAPLPVSTAYRVGILHTDTQETFEVLCGLDAEAISALRMKSCDLTDVDLQTYTSDYARFCENTYAEWYAKNRLPFALVSNARELAGIMWFGQKQLPIESESATPGTVWDTVAIRTYAPFRGKHLAQPFAKIVLAQYHELYQGRSVWLAADSNNKGAIHLYEKLGFKEIGHTDTGRIVMTLQ